jgi:hypothetical protein
MMLMLRRLQRISLARVIVLAQEALLPLMGATPRLASYLRIEERGLEAGGLPRSSAEPG